MLQTGSMRKPLLCLGLEKLGLAPRSRAVKCWIVKSPDFLRRSRQAEVQVDPKEKDGGTDQLLLVTSNDFTNLQRCLNKSYCKAQGIQIIPPPADLVDGDSDSKFHLVFLETKYQAQWGDIQWQIVEEQCGQVDWCQQDR